MSPTTIFAPASTPANAIAGLSVLVFGMTGAIFVAVCGLLIYAVVKFGRRYDEAIEPAQVYGSSQVELAWTVVPMLIVVVLFLATVRVITRVQESAQPADALQVVAVGHQFWWEYRYPGAGVITANELHVPVGEAGRPAPTSITLLSADTDHSFWVPRLAGKTDLIPNRINGTWIEPTETGLYLGQCAQYCGTQHAKMLLRVYVESRAAFDDWLAAQRRPAAVDATVAAGRRVFQRTTCVNCHTIAGTAANGRFGPDLTHVMSRETIAAGIAPNTPENLRRWIRNPDDLKPGSRMPAMNLNEQELDAVTAYLASLR
jgi:cytochrome c oxidase subunit II